MSDLTVAFTGSKTKKNVIYNKSMDIKDIINRKIPPSPWAEGEKIPWNEPGFSARMLKEHLSQDHDLASRRQSIIDRHVAWINETCLMEKPSRILDLGCGPGFYIQRLAQLDHDCVGIDYSPASIDYAKSQSKKTDLHVNYICGDIRQTEFGEGFDLAMLIFGEFNVFRRDDARRLLRRMYDALKPGGTLLLEPQTFDAVHREGMLTPKWYTSRWGLFSDKPHLALEEHFWHAEDQSATTRFFVVDSASGEVESFALTSEAYTDEEVEQAITGAGFTGVIKLPSLTGAEADQQEEFSAVIGRKV